MFVVVGIVGAEIKRSVFADQTQLLTQKRSIGITLTKKEKRWNIKILGGQKMNIIKAACLMIFAFGIAIMSKYIGFKPWVEANCWIGLPMAAIGAMGICCLFGGRGR